MGETFGFLQKLLHTTAGIPLSCVPYDRTALSEFLSKHTNYIDCNFATLWHPLFRQSNQSDTVYQWVATGGITFLLYPGTDGCIVFGPVLTAPFSPEKTVLIPEKALQFIEALPMVENHTLHRTAQLVIGYLTKRTQPLRILPVDPPAPENLDDQPRFSSDEDIIKMRKVENRYEYSIALTEAFRQ